LTGPGICGSLHTVMNDELESLQETVRYYERRVAEAHEALERCRAHLDTAERDLAVAKNFYEIEKRRWLSNAGPANRFAGLTLRQACVSIVRERGRITNKEIVGELVRGGYDFATLFPGRAVHTALMRAPGVRKIGPGLYQAEPAP
jgi:hypothetical protein